MPPKGSNNKWTDVEWTVHGAQISGSPTVKSVGITGSITGTRADLIIGDDDEDPKNSFTVDQREKLKERVREFEDIRKADEGQGANSEVLILGTPQCYESLYEHMASIGYKFRIWPSRYPQLDEVRSYRGQLCPELENELYEDDSRQGAPTDPQRFTHEELVERELKQGKARHQLQFQLNTELSDANRYPLKLSDLIVYTPNMFVAPRQLSHSRSKEFEISDLKNVGFSSDRWRRPSYFDNQQMPYERKILVSDPSGRGGDEHGWAILGTLMGYIYLLDAGGFEGGYDEQTVLIPLAKKAKEWDVHVFVSESNFGDGIFTELFKPVLYRYHKCQVEEVRNNTQKEKRIIDTLEPLMARHRLVVSEDVILNDLRDAERVTKDTGSDYKRLAYSLFYQMTHLMSEKGCLVHDDRLDALAIGVNFLVNEVDRDADFEIQRMSDDEHERRMNRKGRVDLNGKALIDRSLGQKSAFSLHQVNHGFSVLCK